MNITHTKVNDTAWVVQLAVAQGEPSLHSLLAYRVGDTVGGATVSEGDAVTSVAHRATRRRGGAR